MEQLEKYLNEQISELSESAHYDILNRLENLVSVYPFNQYEFIIATLMGLDKITIDDYYSLRDDYIERNMFLYIFEISAPRGFGEVWAHGHLKELVPRLQKPSRSRDPNYSGQYDFMLDEAIRVEVKASRAVDFNSSEPLYVKALDSTSKKRFDMNFQQIKTYCCDVFVWVAVWRNEIRYWVLSSYEVEHNANYSAGQHRGNEGEGQLHYNEKNISQFDIYRASSDQLLQAIRDAFYRQKEKVQ
ncbi:MAG: hypothetical protein Q8M98_07275 [Candidatus Cloacimonadaceae bacterium]|nr:hypothetical protein [Candidatus Cloacimonadaceae bacterium]